jgi:hypothetical protein
MEVGDKTLRRRKYPAAIRSITPIMKPIWTILSRDTRSRISGVLSISAGPGYTFANFWSIVDFGWANVRARTFNYPFSEGDIPDNCRYIRLFLGLKGRGTMWVDNVDFRYSKWNFTPLERLAPFIKKTYAKSELLIPNPLNVWRPLSRRHMPNRNY